MYFYSLQAYLYLCVVQVRCFPEASSRPRSLALVSVAADEAGQVLLGGAAAERRLAPPYPSAPVARCHGNQPRPLFSRQTKNVTAFYVSIVLAFNISIVLAFHISIVLAFHISIAQLSALYHVLFFECYTNTHTVLHSNVLK